MLNTLFIFIFKEQINFLNDNIEDVIYKHLLYIAKENYIPALIYITDGPFAVVYVVEGAREGVFVVEEEVIFGNTGRVIIDRQLHESKI